MSRLNSLVLSLLVVPALIAEDWPQLMGPNRDNGNRVVMNVGGADGSVVGFDTETGKTVWKALKEFDSPPLPPNPLIHRPPRRLILKKTRSFRLPGVTGGPKRLTGSYGPADAQQTGSRSNMKGSPTVDAETSSNFTAIQRLITRHDHFRREAFTCDSFTCCPKASRRSGSWINSSTAQGQGGGVAERHQHARMAVRGRR